MYYRKNSTQGFFEKYLKKKSAASVWKAASRSLVPDFHGVGGRVAISA
jgi:hypothetical protein